MMVCMNCVDCQSIEIDYVRPFYSRLGSRKYDRCWQCYNWPIYEVVSRLAMVLGVSCKQVRRCPELVRYYQMHLLLKKYLKYEFQFNPGEVIEYDNTVAGREYQTGGCDSHKPIKSDVYQQC